MSVLSVLRKCVSCPPRHLLLNLSVAFFLVISQTVDLASPSFCFLFDLFILAKLNCLPVKCSVTFSLLQLCKSSCDFSMVVAIFWLVIWRSLHIFFFNYYSENQFRDVQRYILTIRLLCRYLSILSYWQTLTLSSKRFSLCVWSQIRTQQTQLTALHLLKWHLSNENVVWSVLWQEPFHRRL